jgi:hypothetical protein
MQAPLTELCNKYASQGSLNEGEKLICSPFFKDNDCKAYTSFSDNETL